MNKYKIELSNKAKTDYISIIDYIKNKLQEPPIAKKYAILIKEEVKKLEQFPQKFPTIKLEQFEYREIRKLIIKHFIAFYQIKENEKTVRVLRILYGGTDWENKL